MSLQNKNFLEKITDTNDESYIDYLAEDIIWNIAGSKIIAGKKNFLEALKTEESAPGVYSGSSTVNVINMGDYVVVESEGEAFNEDGRPFKIASCDIYHIKDGRIDEMTTYFVSSLNDGVK